MPRIFALYCVLRELRHSKHSASLSVKIKVTYIFTMIINFILKVFFAMSAAANWMAMGVSAAGFAIVSVLLRPTKGSFESDLGWGAYLFGCIAFVVRFLAEALKFGRWPQSPAAYATNWIRYTGGGIGLTSFILSLCALSRGGVEHCVFTSLGVLAYYAAFTFASLSFETNSAVIGFFVIGAFIFVCTACNYYYSNHAVRTYPMWIPALSFLVEAGFITMAGIEVFHRNTASNSIEDWVFAAIACVQVIWYGLVYIGGVRHTMFSELVSPHEQIATYTVAESTLDRASAPYGSGF